MDNPLMPIQVKRQELAKKREKELMLYNRKKEMLLHNKKSNKKEIKLDHDYLKNLGTSLFILPFLGVISILNPSITYFTVILSLTALSACVLSFTKAFMEQNKINAEILSVNRKEIRKIREDHSLLTYNNHGDERALQ